MININSYNPYKQKIWESHKNFKTVKEAWDKKTLSTAVLVQLTENKFLLVGLFHFGLCDIICLGARCGGFVRCHCLGWTTFPRIPFPVCFWSGQATREVLLQYLGDRSWMAAICSSLISLTLLTHLIVLRLNQAGCYSPFPESPFSFSDFLARGVRLVHWWKALVSTRCAYHQSQRKREWTCVLVCSHGLQVLLLFSRYNYLPFQLHSLWTPSSSTRHKDKGLSQLLRLSSPY